MQRKSGKNNFRRSSKGKPRFNQEENPRPYKEGNKPESRSFDRDKRPDRVKKEDKNFNKEKERPFRDSSENKFRPKPFDKHKKPDWAEKKDKGFRKENDGKFRDSSEREFKKGNAYVRKPYFKKNRDKRNSDVVPDKINNSGVIRLNKYIANAGICSRREADELISSGAVSVNGKVVTEMGFKVQPTDVVNYGGETLRREKPVYVLLNKPKDYITTVDDPQKRKTVLELVRNACQERIYPVGRLDRSTTGVLLFTNDGELTKHLTHPRYGIKKIYHVVLDKNLRKEDFDKIVEGIELEDGPIKVDEINYVNERSKKEIGIEIHSGRNRIVRRIFESLGYVITKLDRVYFGGLTKKDLPKGRWRFLSELEVNMLKMTAK